MTKIASDRWPRRLAARMRRILRVRHIEFDGFTVVGYGGGMPKQMAHRLNRGDYETPERDAVKRHLRRGDRVVEIGACIGVVSLTAARIAGAENVHAFEPNAAAARIARENFRLNAMPVHLEQKAVAAARGTAALKVSGSEWLGAHLMEASDSGAGDGIEVEPIADVVDRIRPTALIIDAEGKEAEILTSCPLQGIRIIIVEMHAGRGEALAAVREHLSAKGFLLLECVSPEEGAATTVETWSHQS